MKRIELVDNLKMCDRVKNLYCKYLFNMLPVCVCVLWNANAYMNRLN